MTANETLSKTVVILELETNEAVAARILRADGHLAGCQIARELLRSAGSSSRITGLAYVEVPSYLQSRVFSKATITILTQEDEYFVPVPKNSSCFGFEFLFQEGNSHL